MKKFILILLLAMTIPLLVSCQNKDDDDVTVRINYAVTYGNSVLHLMMQTDSLANALPDNVSVEWVNIEGVNNIRDALVVGEIDITCFGNNSIISAIENDLPLMILGDSLVTSVVIYSCRPDIMSIDDIQETDKLSVTSIGSTNHLAFLLYCEQEYGDSQRYSDNLMALQASDALVSIISSGEPACAVLTFPNSKKAEEVENLFPILDLTPIMMEYSIGQFFVTSNDFYDKHPDLVEIFNNVCRETIAYMNAQPAEAAMILAELYDEISAVDIEEQLISYPPKNEISESAYNKVSELMYEVGMIPNPPKPFSSLPNYESIPKIP